MISLTHHLKQLLELQLCPLVLKVADRGQQRMVYARHIVVHHSDPRVPAALPLLHQEEVGLCRCLMYQNNF